MLLFNYKRRSTAPVSNQTKPRAIAPFTPVFLGSMFSRAQPVNCTSCPGAK